MAMNEAEATLWSRSSVSIQPVLCPETNDMARRLDSNTYLVRFGIVLLGAGLGYGLRMVAPPTDSVLRDEARGGGARAAVSPVDSSPAPGLPTSFDKSDEKLPVDAGSEEAFEVLDDLSRSRR